MFASARQPTCTSARPREPQEAGSPQQLRSRPWLAGGRGPRRGCLPPPLSSLRAGPGLSALVRGSLHVAQHSHRDRDRVCVHHTAVSCGRRQGRHPRPAFGRRDRRRPELRPRGEGGGHALLLLVPLAGRALLRRPCAEAQHPAPAFSGRPGGQLRVGVWGAMCCGAVAKRPGSCWVWIAICWSCRSTIRTACPSQRTQTRRPTYSGGAE